MYDASYNPLITRFVSRFNHCSLWQVTGIFDRPQFVILPKVPRSEGLVIFQGCCHCCGCIETAVNRCFSSRITRRQEVSDAFLHISPPFYVPFINLSHKRVRFGPVWVKKNIFYSIDFVWFINKEKLLNIFGYLTLIYMLSLWLLCSFIKNINARNVYNNEDGVSLWKSGLIFSDGIESF